MQFKRGNKISINGGIICAFLLSTFAISSSAHDRFDSLIPKLQNDSMFREMHKHYEFEWKINGLRFSGESFNVPLCPTSFSFDTIYYRSRSADSSLWNNLLCKIPEKAEYNFQVNGCCGGFWVQMKGKEKVINKSVVFILRNSDKTMYLGRFGDAGVILKKGKSLRIDNPCECNKSAMQSDEPRITIEMIDTGKIMRDAFERTDEDDPSLGDTLQCLSCFQGRTFSEPDDCFNYYRKKVITAIDFKWFTSRCLIVEFYAASGKVELK
jgi:hypothetical protein